MERESRTRSDRDLFEKSIFHERLIEAVFLAVALSLVAYICFGNDHKLVGSTVEKTILLTSSYQEAYHSWEESFDRSPLIRGKHLRMNDLMRQEAQRNPSNFRNWINLGISYGYMKDWHRALRAWKTAVREAPGSPVAQFSVGVGFAMLNRLEKAAGAYRASLDGDPGFSAALICLADIQARLHRTRDAVVLMHRAVSADRTYHEAHLFSNRVHLGIRDKRPLNHFEELTRLPWTSFEQQAGIATGTTFGWAFPSRGVDASIVIFSEAAGIYNEYDLVARFN